jgi:hypothetical protein
MLFQSLLLSSLLSASPYHSLSLSLSNRFFASFSSITRGNRLCYYLCLYYSVSLSDSFSLSRIKLFFCFISSFSAQLQEGRDSVTTYLRAITILERMVRVRVSVGVRVSVRVGVRVRVNIR